MGFDVWANDNNKRSVASKGIAQASQDSIDDLLGRVYALVRFVNEIKEFESLGVNLEQEGINLQTAMLAHLDTIAQNTEWNSKLGDIMTDIREMKEHGIKVKM